MLDQTHLRRGPAHAVVIRVNVNGTNPWHGPQQPAGSETDFPLLPWASLTQCRALCVCVCVLSLLLPVWATMVSTDSDFWEKTCCLWSQSSWHEETKKLKTKGQQEVRNCLTCIKHHFTSLLTEHIDTEILVTTFSLDWVWTSLTKLLFPDICSITYMYIRYQN